MFISRMSPVEELQMISDGWDGGLDTFFYYSPNFNFSKCISRIDGKKKKKDAKWETGGTEAVT